MSRYEADSIQLGQQSGRVSRAAGSRVAGHALDGEAVGATAIGLDLSRDPPRQCGAEGRWAGTATAATARGRSTGRAQDRPQVLLA